MRGAGAILTFLKAAEQLLEKTLAVGFRHVQSERHAAGQGERKKGGGGSRQEG